MNDIMRDELGAPKIVVDQSAFQAELDALRVREKAHTRWPAQRLIHGRRAHCILSFT
jgi:hypothetical protein